MWLRTNDYIGVGMLEVGIVIFETHVRVAHDLVTVEKASLTQRHIHDFLRGCEHVICINVHHHVLARKYTACCSVLLLRSLLEMGRAACRASRRFTSLFQNIVLIGLRGVLLLLVLMVIYVKG